MCWVAEIYRPGDFVVIKLDIDNVPLETQFMNMIEDNYSLVHMIAEMFFEEHFNDDGKFKSHLYKKCYVYLDVL